MSIGQEIIDYEKNKDEIDKWISLKGECKYMQFVDILKEKQIAVEWKILDDVYRYDKRLLMNLFKYISFFEEYLRAKIWNLGVSTYKALEKLCLKELIDKIIENKEKLTSIKDMIDSLAKYKDEINHLRNCVSHNKILLSSEKFDKNISELIIDFRTAIPLDYQQGFTKSINKSSYDLSVPEKLLVKI